MECVDIRVGSGTPAFLQTPMRHSRVRVTPRPKGPRAKDDRIRPRTPVTSSVAEYEIIRLFSLGN